MRSGDGPRLQNRTYSWATSRTDRPQYGARLLRRVLPNYFEDPLSDALIQSAITTRPHSSRSSSMANCSTAGDDSEKAEGVPAL
jgi:ATP-dependent Clp protease ATP-binding subunit ClpA